MISKPKKNVHQQLLVWIAFMKLIYTCPLCLSRKILYIFILFFVTLHESAVIIINHNINSQNPIISYLACLQPLNYSLFVRKQSTSTRRPKNHTWGLGKSCLSPISNYLEHFRTQNGVGALLHLSYFHNSQPSENISSFTKVFLDKRKTTYICFLTISRGAFIFCLNNFVPETSEIWSMMSLFRR